MCVFRPVVSGEDEDQTVPAEPTVTLLAEQEVHVTTATGHVTTAAGHVTSDGTEMDMLQSPFSRLRSATVSGGGRPKFRPRRHKKPSSGQPPSDTLVTPHDSHVTAAAGAGDSVTPSDESEVVSTAPSLSTTTAPQKEERTEEEEATESDQGVKDDQFIIKCQVMASRGP